MHEAIIFTLLPIGHAILDILFFTTIAYALVKGLFKFDFIKPSNSFFMAIAYALSLIIEPLQRILRVILPKFSGTGAVFCVVVVLKIIGILVYWSYVGK